ncbi:MAG TPA: type VI secretion system tube protein Hcp [Planctomycetaceae bacterium]|nr:type VI secretion system tube protein Hcp [Planctomycetaceae bacterium]|tara:strand:- start:472 stop:969 length:498 start_codon:yes stop_codon:yes gene_type:complete
MAFDAFLQIDGIPGESTDSKHKDWIEIIDYSHTMAQKISDTASSSGARASERANHGLFIVTKDLDKSSPKLAVSLNTGASIAKVRMELCRATGDKQLYMVYEMSDVIVADITVQGDMTGERSVPTEVVSFNYGEIEWTYTVTDQKTGKAAGDITGKWSVVENTGG